MNDETKHLGLNSEQLSAELRQYYGGHEQNYKSQFGPMEYTPGVRFFFLQGGKNGAYWLRDILTTQPEVTRAWKKHGICFVLLEREKDQEGCKLTVCQDLETHTRADESQFKAPMGEIYYQRNIEYSDIQPGQWVFFIESGLMLLPSEH
ncbi:hypothetical protein ATN89_17695 [Comamonas thiooxydans]|uniref:DUF6876 family protein n=1 Tax=Comamonas thiooxydans TaxID=363952 RepID=UPI0007C4FD49|nr:DUF6876 family protein [Comamonas thiooxydans]OAD82916.1 hypothetical protein ATN89_17695 [Comamonas thiooxydans]